MNVTAHKRYAGLDEMPGARVSVVTWQDGIRP